MFVLIVILLGTISAFCENECLTLLWGGQGFNPDSVMVDTCKNSKNYSIWYIRGSITLGFKQYFLRDSLNYGKKVYLNDIDSVKYPSIFAKFKEMQLKFGKLTFQRALDVPNNEKDEYFYKFPCYTIFMDSLNNLKEINIFLNGFSEVRLQWITNYPKVNINRSCLDLLWGGKGENPDLIAEDTCKDSPTYGDRYQRGTWTIGFTKFIFKDSLKVGHGAYLKDIDTINYYDYYLMFNKITQEFGEFTFHRDPDVCNNRWDEGFYPKPCMTIWFNKRFRTKDVQYYLSNLPEYRFIQLTNPPFLSDVIENTQDECIQIIEKNEILIIKLNYESLAQSNDISIFNILGERIPPRLTSSSTPPYQGGEINIYIGDLSPGIYFIKIGDMILKFIKL